MRFAATVIALALSCAAHAASYDIDLGTSLQSGTLKVEPGVSGPANKTLRYEMKVRREGGGSSNSSQSGTVRLDGSGRGHLASTSVSVSEHDRYRVDVKLFDGSELVAEQSAQYP
jgi:hypothetical protein